MLIFLADGRLGNQIFQYVFLKTIRKNKEKIFVSGFEDLKEVFEIDDVINLNKRNKLVRFFLFKLWKPILLLLSNKIIISSIDVKHEKIFNTYRRESQAYTEQIGFFKSITFVKLGFFQSETYFKSEIAKQLKIKNKYTTLAAKELRKIPNDKYKIFIHVRRGDYLKFKVYGKSTLLPLSYYQQQIEWFSHNRENCFFVFLSDEPDYIEKEFNNLHNKLVVAGNHFGVDFAIMTQCNGAVLSPSSFGWWGTYLMKDRDTVFAPKYWMGFNSGMDYHVNGAPSFAKKQTI